MTDDVILTSPQHHRPTFVDRDGRDLSGPLSAPHQPPLHTRYTPCSHLGLACSLNVAPHTLHWISALLSIILTSDSRVTGAVRLHPESAERLPQANKCRIDTLVVVPLLSHAFLHRRRQRQYKVPFMCYKPRPSAIRCPRWNQARQRRPQSRRGCRVRRRAPRGRPPGHPCRLRS